MLAIQKCALEEALPQSGLMRAVKYMGGVWDGLRVVLEHPEVELDDNRTERALHGTEVAALFHTLIESAKLAGVGPDTYLKRAVDAPLQEDSAAARARLSHNGHPLKIEPRSSRAHFTETADHDAVKSASRERPSTYTTLTNSSPQSDGIPQSIATRPSSTNGVPRKLGPLLGEALSGYSSASTTGPCRRLYPKGSPPGSTPRSRSTRGLRPLINSAETVVGDEAQNLSFQESL